MTKLNYSYNTQHSVAIGNETFLVLSDGVVEMDLEKLLGNITPDQLAKALDRYFLKSVVKSSVNCYLLSLEGHLILIDTGAGQLMGSNTGKLPDSLRKAGFAPEDISTILLTHIHGDHSGGLTVDGRAVFPNAEIIVHQADLDHWLNEDLMRSAKPERQKSFVNAMAAFKPYQQNSQVRTFQGELELFRGLSTRPSPGHTPGHTHYVLQSGTEKIVFAADIAHVPLIQFAYPEVSIAFDVDPIQATRSRIRALELAAKEKYWLAASHASFPGIGHVRAEDQGFGWQPMSYSLDGSHQ